MTATIEKATTTAPAPMAGEALPAPAFDYAQLSTGTAATLQALVPEIREAGQTHIAKAVEMGNHLIAAKNLLRFGLFGKWLDTEFGLSERTARNYMRAAQLVGKSASVADLPLSLLYGLSLSLTPGDEEDTKAAKNSGGDALLKAARRLLYPALDDADEDDVAEALSVATITRAELDSISRNAGVLMSGADEAIKRLDMVASVAEALGNEPEVVEG